MKPQIKGLRVASLIFGLMSLGQLTRLLIRPEVFIAGHLIPLWPSILACLVFAWLSVWTWKLTHTG